MKMSGLKYLQHNLAANGSLELHHEFDGAWDENNIGKWEVPKIRGDKTSLRLQNRETGTH